MKRALLAATLAFVLGLGTAEYLARNFSLRQWLGQIVRRGELQTLVGHRGIYNNDVERVAQAERYAVGADTPASAEQKGAVLQRLVERETLNVAAADQAVESAIISREMNLLRFQFPDEKTWKAVLHDAATAPWMLRHSVTDNLRTRQWLETQLAAQLVPNEDENRQYFTTHTAQFQAPPRLRASHLFLAAPEGYPTEVIETKRALIEQLSKRLANGEAFPALVAEFSEDEATKTRGGDLGFFAETHMLPAVFAAAAKLHPGETSAPVRSRLGFHILRLTESLPPRALSFEEAQPEIEQLLANKKRAEVVTDLIASLR
ncbi:MAG: peptidylprolyl isomerase [Chthoniobacterales bacterium]|nr:peptidylprolyl isomerase [Chthoniobacterales bacterium]